MRAGSAVCFNRPISTTWLVISCSTISLCLASTASCALYPTATLVWPAIARLSGSVSETWLSPGPFELRQQRAEPITLAADRLNLLREVVHARTDARSAFRD